MIIFTSVNLKLILKKRKNIPGNALKHARSVMLKKYGDMAMCWRILMDILLGSGLKDTDALSAERLYVCVPKVTFPDFNPR
jgi:hypothetical protein